MLNDDSFVNCYENIWTNFVDSLKIFREKVEKKIYGNDKINMHQILKNIYWIPKDEMIEYLKTTHSNPNPRRIKINCSLVPGKMENPLKNRKTKK